MFYMSEFHTKQDLVLKYPAIVFTMVIGLLNCGSFIVHILLLREQAKSSHCQFFCPAHAFTSFCRAHDLISYLLIENYFKDVRFTEHLQGRIQECHLGGGGGGAKDYVRARISRARSPKSLKGSRGSRANLQISLNITKLYKDEKYTIVMI